MGTMVYKSVQEDFYLVTENYYTDGINYDEVQTKIENVKALKNRIVFSQANGKINISMPTNVKSGSVYFFRPSNGTLDFKLAIPEKDFVVDKSEIQFGKWIMKFSWTDGTKEYYFEESIGIL